MNIEELTTRSEEASELMGLLSNPHRLRVLCELHKGERSVGQLEAVVGLSQSALSQHLAKLRGAGVVGTRRDAQIIHYSLADERLGRLLAVMYEIFCAPPKAKKKVRGSK